MNLRSAIIVSAVLLFVSAPAWGDALKLKHRAASDAIHFLDNAPKFGHSDIKFLGGFNTENSGNHYGFLKFKEDRFVLVGRLDSPSGPTSGGDPVSTPEPASLSLLLMGLIGVGLFAVRRNLSLGGAQ